MKKPYQALSIDESSVDIVKDINLNKYLTANLTKPTINTSNAFYLVNKSAYTV